MNQTVTLNADFFQNLSVIAQDEGLMKRVANYVKRLATKKEDPPLMTKEEFLERIEKAEAQYKRGEYTTLLPGESVSDMLKRWCLS